MIYVIYLIPVLTIISSMLMYRLNGKKQLLKLDLVQFVYAFVLAPALFIWIKSFLYYLLRVEVEVSLSALQIFMIDTAFSTVFLYIFAFVVIHSLTKSFHLQSSKDPLYDIFEHSEFFHLWLTHLIVYVGAMLLISIMAFFNVYYPLTIETSKPLFYFWTITGFMTGIVSFVMIWISDPKQNGANFARVMKLLFGVFFLLHVLLYFLLDPPFNVQHGLYWWSLSLFTALVVCSLFAYKSERAHNLFSRVAERLRHR